MGIQRCTRGRWRASQQAGQVLSGSWVLCLFLPRLGSAAGVWTLTVSTGFCSDGNGFQSYSMTLPTKHIMGSCGHGNSLWRVRLVVVPFTFLYLCRACVRES